MSDVKTFLAFSCPHFPLEDPIAIEWLLEQIKERKPDVIVHLGDGHEADSASRWPSEYDWRLSDEFKAHDDFLSRVRKSCSKSKRVFLPGNHEANIIALSRLDRKIRDLCDYREWVPKDRTYSELQRYWDQPAEYVYNRPRGTFKLGQVTFAHGFKSDVSSDEMQGYDLGLPFGLTVLGHTHRPVAVTQARRTKTVPLPYWFANAGALRDIVDVPYMERKRRMEWGQAIVVGEAATWRYTESLMPKSPQWEAETVIFRTYNDIVSS